MSNTAYTKGVRREIIYRRRESCCRDRRKVLMSLEIVTTSKEAAVGLEAPPAGERRSDVLRMKRREGKTKTLSKRVASYLFFPASPEGIFAYIVQPRRNDQRTPQRHMASPHHHFT